MSDTKVIVTSNTPAPELPSSHPPTPKFVAFAMTSRQNEQGDRINALDRRADSLTGYINAVSSRVETASNTAVAAREAAEAAMQRASREPPAPVKQSETVAWCALGAVAVLAAAFIAQCFGAF